MSIDQKKMSKSLGNFKTIYDLLKKFNGEVIRYFLLQAHYRAPLNFKHEYILEAKSSLSRLYRSIKDFKKNGDPDKEIFCLDPIVCPCATMYRIHPAYVLWVLDGIAAGLVINQVEVDIETKINSKIALERMLNLPK